MKNKKITGACLRLACAKAQRHTRGCSLYGQAYPTRNKDRVKEEFDNKFVFDGDIMLKYRNTPYFREVSAKAFQKELWSFIEKSLDHQRKEIGKEFWKWFNSDFDGECIEDAIERITKVKQ
jgi:hypothetical protein